MPVHRLFDANCHPTVNGRFKDYVRNMPAAVSTILDQRGEGFLLRGCNFVGLPEIGGYRHDKFAALVEPDRTPGFVEYLTLAYNDDIREYQPNGVTAGSVDCIKVHPRFLGCAVGAVDWDDVVDCCKRFGSVLGLCTYIDQSTDIGELVSVCDFLTESGCRVIFFHAFSMRFEYFYSRYGALDHVLFETSFSNCRYGPEVTGQYSRHLKAGRENICFGTDFPDYSVSDCLQGIEMVADGLTEASLDGYLYSNGVRFFDGQ
jgi:hypothetical protein